MPKTLKKPSIKTFLQDDIWSGAGWKVRYGHLKRGKGRPGAPHLFKYIGEKIPFEALEEVKRHFVSDGTEAKGVYVAHDSMGSPRYVGRGQVFDRLRARKKARPRELAYFSFYIVDNDRHESEIETLLIRAAGDQLVFNSRKKRVGISPGDIRDYEPGAYFYERQRKKGTAKRTTK